MRRERDSGREGEEWEVGRSMEEGGGYRRGLTRTMTNEERERDSRGKEEE